MSDLAREEIKKWVGKKKPYDIIKEKVAITTSEPPTILTSAYSKEGVYIGKSTEAYRLWKKYGITKFYPKDKNSKVCSIGYNPKDKKWYGWSHRAIYGFTIGSKVKKGDCGYIPKTFNELRDLCFAYDEIRGKCTIRSIPKYSPTLGQNGKPTGSLKKTNISKPEHENCCLEICPFGLGKGEWEAKTMEDAKQMAIDFAEAVG